MTKEARMTRGTRMIKESKMIKNERLEREIADAVRRFGIKWMALAAKSVTVNLCPRAIVVVLHEALPPAERRYASEAAAAGRRVLRLYAAAFDAVKKRLEIELSRKVRRPVRRSQLRVVSKSGDSVIHVALGARSGGSGRRRRPP